MKKETKETAPLRKISKISKILFVGNNICRLSIINPKINPIKVGFIEFDLKLTNKNKPIGANKAILIIEL